MMYTCNARPFSSHPYAQAALLSYSDGSYALQSYNTIVVEIDPEGWLMVNGLYSMTTRRHIGWFMQEVAHMSYATARGLYQDEMMINIFTGEVKKIGE